MLQTSAIATLVRNLKRTVRPSYTDSVTIVDFPRDLADTVFEDFNDASEHEKEREKRTDAAKPACQKRQACG